MNRAQLILIFLAIALVVFLYQLPRSVVENDQLQEVQKTENHSLQVPQEVENQINELRSLIKTEIDLEKKATFAHSLARRFLDYGILDSAEAYASRIETWEDNPSEKAADIYFTAYERSPSAEIASKNAGKAKALLEKLLEEDPANYFLKNRLAMTMVVSENPMAGIMLLREIVAADATNRQAILNLGLLAIQSGQYDKAKGRFEKLVQLDANDNEAKLYLAVSMMEVDQKPTARLILEEILASQDSIPAIKMMANDYLKML